MTHCNRLRNINVTVIFMFYLALMPTPLLSLSAASLAPPTKHIYKHKKNLSSKKKHFQLFLLKTARRKIKQAGLPQSAAGCTSLLASPEVSVALVPWSESKQDFFCLILDYYRK